MSTADYNNYLMTEGLNGGVPLEVTSSVIEGVITANPMTNEIKEENAKIIRININKILSNNPSYAKKSIKLIDGKYYLTDRIKADLVTVSKDVDLDLNKIAAAEKSTVIPGDGGNALKMAATRNNVKLYAWGSPADFVKSLVTNLGVDKQEATRVFTNQTVQVKQITVSKESYSGVSLDEEMSDMIRFQQAYNANARMLTTFDELIDIIINKMGLVGR
jgi:flagellar hook-associated protein 1 FlgK